MISLWKDARGISPRTPNWILSSSLAVRQRYIADSPRGIKHWWSSTWNVISLIMRSPDKPNWQQEQTNRWTNRQSGLTDGGINTQIYEKKNEILVFPARDWHADSSRLCSFNRHSQAAQPSLILIPFKNWCQVERAHQRLFPHKQRTVGVWLISSSSCFTNSSAAVGGDSYQGTTKVEGEERWQWERELRRTGNRKWSQQTRVIARIFSATRNKRGFCISRPSGSDFCCETIQIRGDDVLLWLWKMLWLVLKSKHL